MNIIKNSLFEFDCIDRYWDHFKSSDHLNTPSLIKRNQIGGNILSSNAIIRLFRTLLQKNDISLNVDGIYLDNPTFSRNGLEDNDFFEYLNEIKRFNNGKVITITKDYCLSHSKYIHKIVSYFSKHYLDEFGLPSSDINAVAIAGHYSETWIGLHNDYCETFLIPIEGNKNFYLWPPEYFESERNDRKKNAMNGYCLGKVDIEEHKILSSEYKVEPGDIFYIPKRWWHYNKLESPENTLTLSIGFFDDPNANYTGDIYRSTSSQKNRILPPKENLVSRAFIDSIAESNRKKSRESNIIDILSRLSSNGIRTKPPSTTSEPSKILTNGEIHLTGNTTKIYVLRIKNNHGLVFSNGDARPFEHIDLATKIIETLYKTKKISCSDDLVTNSPSTADLIRWLIITGSVIIV